MPICPGCERVVSYDQLPMHERYCDGLRETTDGQAERVETLATEMTQTCATLSRRVRHLEGMLERQATEAETQNQD